MSSLAEQEAIIEAVTGNGSHPEASPVTRNACGRCEQGWERGKEWHCRACHADSHCACAWCNRCMPDRHRRDRRYCSSTCRVRGREWRHSPEGQAARQVAAAEQQAWLESDAGREYTALVGMLPERQVDQQQRARWEHAFKTGETCAHCGRELGAGPVFWTAAKTGGEHPEGMRYPSDERRAAPACADCATACNPCRAAPGPLCDRCRPRRAAWTWLPDGVGSLRVRQWTCPEAGPDHRGQYCGQCHPATWQAASCPGCERTVLLRRHVDRWGWLARPHGNRRRQHLHPDDTDEGPPIAYCSQRCRSRVDHERAATRRIQARQEQGPRQCGGCGEVLDGKRLDARYCSGACRQRAYRQRDGDA